MINTSFKDGEYTCCREVFTSNDILSSVSQPLHCQTVPIWKLFILFTPHFNSWQPHSHYLKRLSRKLLFQCLVRWVQTNYQASTWQCPYLMSQHTPFSAVGPTKQNISCGFLSLVHKPCFCFFKAQVWIWSWWLDLSMKSFCTVWRGPARILIYCSQIFESL